jgi:hypothetical protein
VVQRALVMEAHAAGAQRHGLGACSVDGFGELQDVDSRVVVEMAVLEHLALV